MNIKRFELIKESEGEIIYKRVLSGRINNCRLHKVVRYCNVNTALNTTQVRLLYPGDTDNLLLLKQIVKFHRGWCMDQEYLVITVTKHF